MFSVYPKLLGFYGKLCESIALFRSYLLSCQRSQYIEQAVAWTTEKSCFGTCQKQDTFLFSKASRLALEANPVLQYSRYWNFFYPGVEADQSS
jgi:hypothetical protein